MTPKQFETRRLALLAAHGLDCRSVRIADDAGRETYAVASGDGPCPTILVHGGLSQGGEWCTVAGKLTGPVVIPDRPGCGLSYPMDYTGVDYQADAARWLRSVVDHLGAEQVDVVGSSMGGYFGTVFALAHPERVRNLVLLGAPAGLDRWVPFPLRLLGLPGIGSFISRRMATSDPEKLRRGVFTSLVAHPERVPHDSLEVSAANQSFTSSQRCTHTMLHAALDFWGFRRELMLRESLAGLPVRTLFLWGESDSFASPQSGREVAQRMPDARFEVVEDAGHLVHFDAPDFVARHINEFLAPSVALSQQGEATSPELPPDRRSAPVDSGR